jgi:protein-arginine kinase
MIEVLPGHLQCKQGGQVSSERRDNLRATLLQERLKGISYN